MRENRVPQEDVARRAAYQALCDGAHTTGRRGVVVFAVYTLDLDEGRGDLYVAAGLGLALVELGYGVRLVSRHQWHLVEKADVFVSMLPDVDPSLAPAGAWKVAWVRNETDRWAAIAHLAGYDQVIASSRLSLARMERATDRAFGILPIGVDTALFTPGSVNRGTAAVSTAHHWGTLRDVHIALAQLPDDADALLYGHARGELPAGLRRWRRPAISYFALPDVYAHARIVIDDMNATTRGYGSVNSRFFEAAASGAFVVSNGSLGFADLGIDDVPRYRSPAELVSLLLTLRNVPRELAERADAVRNVVRERHSWDVRAGQFIDLIARGREHGAARPPVPSHAIHFFPDYRVTNPYQDMLYSSLGSIDAYPVASTDFGKLLRQRIETSGDPGVVHLHWTAPILQWAGGPYRAKQALDLTSDAVREFKRRGGRLVWTVHNVLPHDGRHRWAEVRLAQLLAEHADLIHLMSEAAIDDAAPYYTIDPAKVVLIRHSSYRGIYPDWIDREAARRKLGISPGEKVLLALGGVRPYKGLGRLFDVFERLVGVDPTLRLLVAGRPAKLPGVSELIARAEEMPRVIGRFDHLPDDQLQVWLYAADVAVLPYVHILNSGALLLAQSFGLPVVAPHAGAVRELDGQRHVRLFNSRDDASLGSALEDVLAMVATQRDDLRESSLRYADTVPPATMAREFNEAVAPILRPDLHR